MLILDKEPNECHRKLVELERTGKLTMVITQNIDGLHYKAGSKKVCELHGSVLRNYCTRCGKFVSGEELKHTLETVSIPHCARCGAVVKPDVVLYEESLKNEDIETAIKAIEECDTLIVGGTSLVVYPAAGLIRHFKGKHLVLINLDETPFDNMATLIIRDKIGNVFSQLDIK